jgi:hypothetical protein
VLSDDHGREASVVVAPSENWQEGLHANKQEARALLQLFHPEEFSTSEASRPARKSAKGQVAKDDLAA